MTENGDRCGIPDEGGQTPMPDEVGKVALLLSAASIVVLMMVPRTTIRMGKAIRLKRVGRMP